MSNLSESSIQRDIWLAIGSLPSVKLFRNNVGVGWCGQTVRADNEYCLLKHPRRVRFGLRPGSGDLIGWKTITITPDMVGRQVAVFTSIETKSSTGNMREDQENWQEHVCCSGGLAGMARGIEDARGIVGV